jgi:predicted ATP-grasp superfamily ATP-dependent carboligase
MELTERRTGRSQAGLHLSAYGFPLPAKSIAPTCGRDVCWGKAIVFAEKPVYVSLAFDRHLTRCASLMEDQSLGWPMVTDRPRCGTVIQAGHPISTIFASAQTPGNVLRSLREHVGEIVRVL